MKKAEMLTGIVAVLIIVLSAWFIFANLSAGPVVETGQEGNGKSYLKEDMAVLVIDNGEGEPESFELEIRPGMTVFDLLKEKAEESGLRLQTKSFDIGVMIEAIGSKENGQDGKYWLYYLNGEMPMISVDKQMIVSGDILEFRFEASPF